MEYFVRVVVKSDFPRALIVNELLYGRFEWESDRNSVFAIPMEEILRLKFFWASRYVVSPSLEWNAVKSEFRTDWSVCVN